DGPRGRDPRGRAAAPAGRDDVPHRHPRPAPGRPGRVDRLPGPEAPCDRRRRRHLDRPPAGPLPDSRPLQLLPGASGPAARAAGALRKTMALTHPAAHPTVAVGPPPPAHPPPRPPGAPPLTPPTPRATP